jgi:pyruvate kinase
MQKRTKIVATLGPSTDNPAVMERMLNAGLNLVRLNFSHGSLEEHQKRIDIVRAAAQKMGIEIGILGDLQGPKIRIARFKEGKIHLQENAQFILDANLAEDAGTDTEVGIDYKALPQDVSAGDVLLLNDGLIVLTVKSVANDRIICQVKVGGDLSNNKGINRLGGGLSAKALTDKDKVDLQYCKQLDVDYVAISFPRNAADINETRALLNAVDSQAGIIAKIERTEAVTNLDEIIKASDGVMVARGDLAVEIGDAEVPGVQKYIIDRARALDKPVITATQMMESMIHNSVPTRAEVSDVANAVLDGTDAVMLSAESAVGDHPDLVVAALSRICLAAEKSPRTKMSRHRVECQFTRVDEAIAMATMYTANHMHIKAIVALTESGATPLWMSRIRSGIPIYGLSRHASTRRKMTLYRGVYPVQFNVMEFKTEEINKAAIAQMQKLNFAHTGDLVILTKGDHTGILGGTNAMKILQVGNVE